jgi:hypothetical protein
LCGILPFPFMRKPFAGPPRIAAIVRATKHQARRSRYLRSRNYNVSVLCDGNASQKKQIHQRQQCECPCKRTPPAPAACFLYVPAYIRPSVAATSIDPSLD